MIELRIVPAPAATRGSYTLTVEPSGVKIQAGEEAGLFYGVQTLLQLLPPVVYAKTPQNGTAWSIPACRITDEPMFDEIRGLLVDVARHFYPKQEIFDILDLMAMHKLNTLHLHLSDHEGWRVEIKDYPALTTSGAPFYSREDVRQIVAHARARHIQIIPEIDMPGHMGAAIKAYPELNGPPRPHTRVKNGIIRIDDKGIEFAKTVLRDVHEQFGAPKYLHMGVDEVRFSADQDAQVTVFVKEVSTFVKQLNAKPIMWDDAFTYGYRDPDTVIHWWRYGKVHWWKALPYFVDEELMKQNQPCILSPANTTYLDGPSTGQGGWAGPLSVAQLYNWDPLRDLGGYTAGKRPLILGTMTCLWGEAITSIKDFGDRVLPSLAAFSEKAWGPSESTAPRLLKWPEYRDSVLIPYQLKRYDAINMNYWAKGNTNALMGIPDKTKPIHRK